MFLYIIKDRTFSVFVFDFLQITSLSGSTFVYLSFGNFIKVNILSFFQGWC